MKSISFDEWYASLSDDIKERTKDAELEGITFVLVDYEDMMYTICTKEGYGVDGDSDEDIAVVGMHYPQQIVNALNSIKLSEFYKAFPEELGK